METEIDQTIAFPDVKIEISTIFLHRIYRKLCSYTDIISSKCQINVYKINVINSYVFRDLKSVEIKLN